MGCYIKSIDLPTQSQVLTRWSSGARKEAVKGYPVTFLMEPTGVYYERLAYHLHKIGQTVYVVLPNGARSSVRRKALRPRQMP